MVYLALSPSDFIFIFVWLVEVCADYQPITRTHYPPPSRLRPPPAGGMLASPIPADPLVGDILWLARRVKNLPARSADMGALGAVYSSADRLKRTLRDLFAQPEAYAEQVAGQIRDTMRDKPAEAVLEQWGPGSGVKTLAGILRSRGLPVMTSSGDDLFQKAKLMSERARPAYGR